MKFHLFPSSVSRRTPASAACRFFPCGSRTKSILLLACAFLLGSAAGKISTFFTYHENNTVQTSASGTGWGLSFQEEGKRPVGNATVDELAAYDAWYARDTDEKILYLTFDCGYEDGNMPAILAALKKHQVPATFFVVGNFIKDNPALLKQMAAEGHTIGNHTLTHPNMSKLSSREAFQAELSGVEKLYEETVGAPMEKFYRPPQGIYSTENLSMAKELGYKTFSGALPM